MSCIDLQEKEAKMVEADVLAVEVKRLRLALSSHADKVFGLEHRKSQLRLGMEERLHQIQVICNEMLYKLSNAAEFWSQRPLLIVGFCGMASAGAVSSLTADACCRPHSSESSWISLCRE